ncbi:hypothetical protein CC1G_15331 [Coprinopsis cinerea okayama7|uniref:Uncharacterized protein n=1 Tax=Coprinopsis cinerea (strain Okayama-7 / 130 / ATCC MYA-4618 / FGSC 9003) TaxID=240176 RepID=D6RQ10_COPC7|nr:hypothetical protein CC1G_15331 [Coprinopsis cinerea okayama7\|eukprot:XP_002910424.1 hypothetical protein CC1G_15331 [Coprinopsis cinerea okayama7\
MSAYVRVRLFSWSRRASYGVKPLIGSKDLSAWHPPFRRYSTSSIQLEERLSLINVERRKRLGAKAIVDFLAIDSKEHIGEWICCGLTPSKYVSDVH